jgi:hypothetical protein
MSEPRDESAGIPEPLENYYVFPACEICSAEMERVECWHCGGEGGFHDCGEDCCCCLYPEDNLNEACQECRGEGSYWQCPNVPHQEGYPL